MPDLAGDSSLADGVGDRDGLAELASSHRFHDLFRNEGVRIKVKSLPVSARKESSTLAKGANVNFRRKTLVEVVGIAECDCRLPFTSSRESVANSLDLLAYRKPFSNCKYPTGVRVAGVVTVGRLGVASTDVSTTLS